MKTYQDAIYSKCKTPEEVTSNMKSLEKFLEYVAYKDGIVDVSYKTDKDGRMYGKPHTIQNISGVVRNFLLRGENLVDIDIVNAIGCVMMSICKKHNLECDTLAEYYNNRKNIIIKYYGGDKELCKDFVNSSFFKSWDWIKTSNTFEDNLKKDIKIIQEFMFIDEDYTKYKEHAIETCDLDNFDNVKGRTCNYAYADIECDILKKAMEYYQSQTNKEIRTPMYDGFIAEKTDTLNLSKLNELMTKLLNSPVEFIYKPISQNIIPKMPDNFQSNINSIKAQYYYNFLESRKVKLTEADDSNFAEIMLNLYGDDFVFQHKLLSVYYEGKWYTNNDYLAKNYIQKKLSYVYLQIISYHFDLLRELGDGEDVKDRRKNIQETLKFLNKANNKLKFQTTLNTVLESFKTKLSGRCDKMEFDVSMPYVLCFKNKAFDTRTGLEYKVKKTDYITFSTGYDYEKPTLSEMKLVGEIIDSIFPNAEIKKTYMSILRTALTAIRQEKFFMANGCGRNGKGVINEFVLVMLGDEYAYTGNINLLTKQIGSGPNPEAANLNKKRFVKFEEPNDTDKLQLGNIKKLTGEGYLNARLCNSNDTKVKLDMTIIFECNNKPSLNGSVGEAIVDRFVDVLFSAYFTKDEDALQTNPNAKPINLEYKQLPFQQKHRCALFDYIIKYAEKDLYVADCVKSRTRDYLLDNDELFGWFVDTYEKSKDPNQILVVKDILFDYKDSDLYSNMSKSEKRKCNDNFFRQMVETNIELRKYYVERIQVGKVRYSSVLIGWKRKDQEYIEM
jgi:phage/plasmid-associated DNA primase